MRVAVPERGDELINRDILIHRVIARLNIGGPAMHVVLLTREFEGRPVPDVGGAEFAQSDAGSDPGAGGSSDAAAFHARLVAGSVMESEGDMSYFAEERGVEVTRLEEMSREVSLVDDLRSFVELWRLFRRERPDIVHTHTAKAGALGRLAAALAGVPVRIHTYHGHVLGGDYFSPQETAFFRGVEKALSVLTQRLIVLTSAQREEMSARMAVADAEKFAVVPLGLELEPYAVAGIAGGDAEADPGGGTAANDEAEAEKALAETRASARSTLDLDPDDLVVGIVGRLVPIKNHELLFDAVPRLLERLKGAPTLRVLVVGSGEREEALK
ncbi:MAG: glycosyltransferase, partial [Gemmatimonadota bacterium]